MRRFKIGQKVVVVKSHLQGLFRKGEIFEVVKLSCCPICGIPTIIINKDINWRFAGTDCLSCNGTYKSKDRDFREIYFAPFQNDADAIEYKLKVSIPELTEIKELQNQ